VEQGDQSESAGWVGTAPAVGRAASGHQAELAEPRGRAGQAGVPQTAMHATDVRAAVSRMDAPRSAVVPAPLAKIATALALASASPIPTPALGAPAAASRMDAPRSAAALVPQAKHVTARASAPACRTPTLALDAPVA